MDGVRSSVALQMWDAPGAGIEPKSPALAGGPLNLSHKGSPDLHFYTNLRYGLTGS